MDFYQKVRRRMKSWAEKEENRSYRWLRWLLLAPDLFHLLVRLAADPRVSVSAKGKLAVAIAYFISPLDLLPELFLGMPGFLDDMVLAAYTLNGVLNQTDPGILEEHWAGEQDLLEVIQGIIRRADRMLGSGLLKKLKRLAR
jgi:uncharacterized membrane protein YkvA (DUF1232 family)